MLSFEPFSLPALQSVLPYVKSNPSLCSDLSAGYLYMWHEGADVRFCVWNDTFVVRQNVGEQCAFSYPFGADPDGMIDQLAEYARFNRLPLRFFAVDEKTLAKIRADGRLQPAAWAYDRQWSDYLYSFEDASTFHGRKFGGQRNHVNKFKKLYGEPDVRWLAPEDEAQVGTMLCEYETEHPDGNALERLELARTRQLFGVCVALDLYAAGLFVNGKLAALSIGERIGETLHIHAEKALKRYEGIYPTMYSGFVRLVLKRLEKPLTYVNREDDSGDPGLRISKTQYHPLFLAHKYLVNACSPAAKGGTPCLYSGGVVLTGIRESDKRAYLRLNADIENNRYWGYDYREDLSIPETIDENTFYDSVLYDTSAGDSVNFAVRRTLNGEMIGEAILWNFTSDGAAEIGCRILPEFQGAGCGTAAFRAAADYARQKLGLQVRARCHRENTPSFRMIVAAGFTPVREDETFFYFENRESERAEPGLCAALFCRRS